MPEWFLMALRLKCVHVGMLYVWYVAENMCVYLWNQSTFHPNGTKREI